MGSSPTHSSRRCAAGVTSIPLIALIGLIGLGACSASDEKSSSVATAAAAATVAAGDVEVEQPEALAAAEQFGDGVALESGAAPATGVALPAAPPLGSALAIVAEVTIEAQDVREAVIALPKLVGDKGGAIFDTDIAVGDPETATASVTVKVPPADMESLIAGLGVLGELVGRTQQTEDVADQIADTDARIHTAQASVDRVRALLADAVTLDDVVRIESELTVRETALEQLLASQRNLNDRVQLATLTIVITPTGEELVVAVGKKSTGIGDALNTGWHKFTGVLHGFAVAVAYGAPFLVIVLVGSVVGLVLRRRLQHAAPSGHIAEPTV